MINIYYVSDEGKFHFKGLKGRNVTKEAAAKRLMEQYPERFSAEWLAYKFLEDIQENCAVTSNSLKEAKINEAYLDWQVLYDALKDKLPLLFTITEGADKLVFTVNARNEVQKIAFKNNTELTNALQKDAVVWRILRDFYQNYEPLQAHKHKISFYEFIRRLTTEFLIMDEEKLIDPNDIKRISWHQDEYAYKKFDISMVAPGPMPAWNEFLSRLDYPEIFGAWVWSIIEPDNNVRQAMWLVGQGDDGKSVVQKALTALLGRQYVKSMQARELGEKFFLSGVYGKVLVNYADCDEIYLLNNPKIKQITGGDSTSIEFKSKDSFTGDVYAKLFITSNKNPKINPESRAQVTRLIRLDVKRPTQQTAGFQTALESEIYAFLDYCKTCFLTTINEGHNRLILPPELQEKIFSLCAAESYNLVKEFFHNKVELGADYYCPISRFRLALREFATLEQHIDSSQMRHFVADIEDKIHLDGIQAVRTEVAGSMITAYKGFKIKGDK